MKKLDTFQNSERFIVSQSNHLIEANYPTSMTARAYKVSRLIIALVNPDDKNLRTYTVKIDSLKRYLGMSPNTKWGAFYKELRGIQDKLNEKPIEIREPNGGWIRTPLLGLKVSRDGTITFEISGLLKPYLLELKKNFTSYQLVYIPKLRSGYSIRLYELLCQYRKIGKRYFILTDLQKKVGSDYKLYGDFKRKVLLQAQKDLKKYTDLLFVFHEQKKGRKVIGVQFIIFGNTPEQEDSKQLSFLEDTLDNINAKEKPALSERIIEILNELGISEQNVAKYLAKGFDIIANEEKRKAALQRCTTLESYYLEKLELIRSSNNQENPAGFLIKALKEDWTTNKSLQISKSKEVVKAKSLANKQIKSLEVKIDHLLKHKEKIKAPILQLLVGDKDILKSAYEIVMNGFGGFIKNHVSSVKHLPIKEQYKKQMTIQQGINLELANKYPEKFKEVSDIEAEIQGIQKKIKQLKKEYHLS